MIAKEMVYTSNGNVKEILCEDEYKGYHFVIVSYGTHPCAYVKIPRSHPYFNLKYDEINDIVVHGGLTYSGLLQHLPDFRENETNWFIGWDYAHAGDYFGGLSGIDYFTREPSEKMWSTHEILSEVRFVIKQLIKAQKKHQKEE